MIKSKRWHHKLPCCVKNCDNNFQECGDEFVFHALPKNEIVRAQWIKKLFTFQEELFSQPKHIFVCSKHFTGNDKIKKHLPCGRFKIILENLKFLRKLCDFQT